MQKLGVGLGALAVAAVAGLPMISGYLSEQAFRQGIGQMQEPGISVSLLEYERGYLEASARTRIELTDPMMREELEAEGVPTLFELRHAFKHGLFSVTGESLPVFSDEQREMVNELWGEGAEPIRLDTETDWQGQTDFQLTVDGFDFAEGEARLNWSELVATGESGIDGSLRFEMNWPGMQLEDGAERITLETLAASGQGQMHQGLWLGDQTFSLARFAIDSEEVGAVLEEFSAVMNNHREGDLYAGHSELKVASLALGESRLDNLAVRMQANGFDAEAVEQLSINQNLADSAQAQAFTAALDRLVARGFELEVKPLSADLADGALNGEVQLKLLPGLEQASQMPFAVLQQLDGRIHLSLPRALMDNPFWAEEIGALVQMGLLVPEEELLVLNASIKPGQPAQLNGQPLPM